MDLGLSLPFRPRVALAVDGCDLEHIDFTVGRKCVESECDDDLIIIEQENLEALSRGTDFSPEEAWTDAVAAMGPARVRMFSSDADDVEPVPGLGFGLGID